MWNADDMPRDPVTGRVPTDPNDLRDPTTIPQWSIGSFGATPEKDDKRGMTEIELRMVEVVEDEYKRLQSKRRGCRAWGEALYATRAAHRAWKTLYYVRGEVVDGEWQKPEHPSKNEGASHRGWGLSLDWQARLY